MSDNYIEKNKNRITSSKLNDFLHCQYLYKLRYLDRVVPETESDALAFGSAFDLYIRSKDEFSKKYIIVEKRFDPQEKIDKIAMDISELEAEIAELEKKEKPAVKSIESRKNKIALLKEQAENTSKLTGIEQVTSGMGEKLVSCLNEFQRQPLYQFDPSKAQVEVEIEYKGMIIGGTMDELDLDNTLIADNKTTASLNMIRKYLDKYKTQLSFYQFLVQVKYDVLCNGKLNVITKEDQPKAEFFWASKESLLDHRAYLLESLNKMIDTIKLGLYASADSRDKCIDCPAYGVCPHSLQKEFTQF